MLMCVLVEGAIYRYTMRFRRPFLASLGANAISLLAGIPLAFLAVLDPTWFVLATAVSILVEYYFLRGRIGRFVLVQGKLLSFWPVLWANVVTNVLMVAYLWFAIGRA